MAGHSGGSKVMVASVQVLMRGNRSRRWAVALQYVCNLVLLVDAAGLTDFCKSRRVRKVKKTAS